METLHKALFDLMAFFQKKSQELAAPLPACRWASTEDHMRHLKRLDEACGDGRAAKEMAKQTLREKRMQAELEKVEKMMEVHDFSLNAASKEAHIDRKTVRRWKKLKEKEEGKKLAYKFPGYKMPPRKKGYQELVKSFIDKHHGNVRLKDIQDYLQKDFEFKVSQ